MKENMSLIIGVLGIIITIFFYYKGNSYRKSQSVFYIYKTIAAEKLVKHCRLQGLIYGGLVMSIYLLLSLNSSFNFLEIKEGHASTIFAIGSIAVCGMVLLQTVCNNFIAFGNVCSIEKKLNKGEVSCAEYTAMGTFICIAIAIIGWVLLFIIKDNDWKNNILFITLLLCLVIKSVYGSFLNTYINLRLSFRVDDITVKTKCDVYEKIYNYKLAKGYYEITYEAGSELKCVMVPEHEICFIEKSINGEKRLIDVLNELDNKEVISQIEPVQFVKQNKKIRIETDNSDNAINLLILMLTSMLAPIIAHALVLHGGINASQWTTERILVLYFAAITGYILSDKLFRLVKKSGLYERGIKLGDSDALPNLIWMAPVSIVLLYYDTLEGTLILIGLSLLSIIILWKDRKEIVFSTSTSFVLAVFVIMYIVVFSFAPYEGSIKEWITILVGWLVAQFVVCLIWDIVAIYLKKHRTGKK